MVKCYKKDYPRPQFVREDWDNLNGSWEFAFDDEDRGEREKWFQGADGAPRFPGGREIQVPFTYETKSSGIGDETRHVRVWYGRILKIDGKELSGCRYLLHFEGSDFLTKVWVNGQFAGEHRGGYARFSLDITGLVRDGDNLLVAEVQDSSDKRQPRGKQRWSGGSFGCWYIQTTGIWKTVWGEYVPKVYLDSVKMTPELAENVLEVEYRLAGMGEKMEHRLSGMGEDTEHRLAGMGEDAEYWSAGIEENAEYELEVEAVVSFDGKFVTRCITALPDGRGLVRIDVEQRKGDDFQWGVRAWSPQWPSLYDIEFRLLQNGQVTDRVDSYFAMREIRIDGSHVLLNGSPLYQRLILDQGYWRDSHLTPPSEEALVEDIDKILALGYNGLRKHQKIEDERFLFWCDVKGVLVWSEMASAYEYDDSAVAEFIREWMEIMVQNYNHPCIITWTPFNESWGVGQIRTNRTQQHFTEAVYHLTKSFDRYRPVIVNDGWEHTVSDILTLHDYEEEGEILRKRYTDHKEQILQGEFPHNHGNMAFAKGFKYQGQPVIISEFGGIAFDSGDEEGWGYGNKVSTEEEFIRRFDAITGAIQELPYVCGYCYTQVTDVQQEINGLMDMDRNYKVNPEAIREINERKGNL